MKQYLFFFLILSQITNASQDDFSIENKVLNDNHINDNDIKEFLTDDIVLPVLSTKILNKILGENPLNEEKTINQSTNTKDNFPNTISPVQLFCSKCGISCIGPQGQAKHEAGCKQAKAPQRKFFNKSNTQNTKTINRIPCKICQRLMSEGAGMFNHLKTHYRKPSINTNNNNNNNNHQQEELPYNMQQSPAIPIITLPFYLLYPLNN